MIRLREAVADDFAAICRLVKTEQELFLVYPGGSFPFTIEQIHALSQVRRALTVAEMTGDKASDKTGDVIGFANLYDFEPGQYAFIGNVVVGENHRGKGAGKALVEYMLKLMFEKYELAEARISVFTQNVPALLLYAHLDFEPYAIEERYDWDNRRVALLHMKKKRDCTLPG